MESLSPYCSHCFKIGHQVEDCKFLSRKKDITNEKKHATETVNGFKVVNDGRQKQGTMEKDPIVIEEAEETSKRKQSGTHCVNNVIHEDGTQGKSPHITQNNRFDVLVQKELVIYKEHDKVLEEEINIAIENEGTPVEPEKTSSQDDEFVDNTQMFPILERIETELPMVSQMNAEQLEKERLLELEKKNKEFLANSWANIIDDEDAEQRLLNHLEEDPQHDFQVVCRSKDKATKKKTHVKTSYQTRKKAGNSKPLR